MQTLLLLLAACVVFACAPDGRAGEGPAQTRTAIIEASIEPLHVLLKSPDRSVKLAAIRALTAAADERSISHLMAAIRNDRAWSSEQTIRCGAAEGLARIGEPALVAMRKELNGEFAVRRTVLEYIGEVGKGAVVDDIAPHLGDGNWKIRSASCRGLGRTGSPTAVPHLLKAANDEQRWVRVAALNALEQVGDASAAEGCLERLGDPDSNVREIVNRILVNLAEKKQLPAKPLIEALASTNALVRRDAAVLCGKAELAAAAPGLRACLDHDDPLVRRAAVEGLGLVGDTGPAGPVLALVDDKVFAVRKAAVRALGRLKAGKAVERLSRLAVEDPGQLGREAGRSLAAIGKPAWPRIKTLTEHKDARVRAASMALAVDAELPDAAELLTASAKSGDSVVRLAALDALTTNAVPAAVKPVMELVDDPDPWVRHAVVCALDRMGDPAARPALQKALKDAKPFVVGAAVEALEKDVATPAELQGDAVEEPVAAPAKEAVAAAVRDLKNEDDKCRIEAANRIRTWLSGMGSK